MLYVYFPRSSSHVSEDSPTSQGKTLHEDLISRYCDRLADLLKNTHLRTELEALREDYVSAVNTSEVSIVSYTLSRGRKSDSMNIWGKLIIMLHGSVLYDVNAVLDKIASIPELLYSKAVLAGRMGQHEQVLSILAIDLQDLASAETYCTHAGNGDILSARNVRDIMQTLEVSPHPSALYRKDGRRKQATQLSTTLTPERKEDQRKDLLNLLIKIQLERSATAITSLREQERTAHILETQAIRISTKEILPSIPDDWPLPLMQNFLVRNMRRTLHERYEMKLVKALLQSQTLDTSLRYWDMTDRLGGVLAEEAEDEDDIDGDDTEVIYLEKTALSPVVDEKSVDLF